MALDRLPRAGAQGMVQMGTTQREAGVSSGLREMQRRAVAVESHVDVGTMLQVVPKQVHLPVARRRVERHGAYLDPRHTSRVTRS